MKCHTLVAGVDEVGRGPLAGPVVAAAVILDPQKTIAGLADSKQLTMRARQDLVQLIQRDAQHIATGLATVEEIDRLNILQASLLAMHRAVMALAILPRHVFVDGPYCPPLPCTATAVIKGDSIMAAISAASIVAKVTRDTLMIDLDKSYPGYGFAQHMGYLTKQHRDALAKLGVSAVHRKTFKPVQAQWRLAQTLRRKM